MFDPTRGQVRDMFFEAWRRYRAGSQRDGSPPDAGAYLDCLVKRAWR